MSTIAAGTTSGTALVSAGDTTGTLVLQTNGTTTAVTIGTNQVMTLVQPLPVGSGGTGGSATPTAGGVVYGTGTVQAVTAAGTAGQYLQSNAGSAPTWVTAPNDFVALSTVNATSGTTVTITITGSYSSYLLTGYKIGTDTSSTTTDLLISVFDENTFYDNGGTWTQSAAVLNNIGTSSGGSSFNLMFNGLTDTNSNTKTGTGTGYGYYSGVHCIAVEDANNTGVSSIVFTLSGGVTFDNGVFKLYGIT
jgi:hypothetical protein